ncbi:MAG: hypothetical protein QXI27_02265 [Nitrososphaerota archaeon]
MRRKNSCYLSIIAFLLIISFLFFSSPGLLSASKSAIVVKYVEGAVGESLSELIPVRIKIVYLVEGKTVSRNPPIMAYIGIGVYARRTVVNNEVEFYLPPSNYSLTVFLSDRRLPTWRDIIKISSPLHITVIYEETKYKPLKIEIVGNHTTNISRATVTLGPINGQRVYASLPVLYFCDHYGNLSKYPDLPESGDYLSALPYYMRIDKKDQTYNSNNESIQLISSPYSFQFLVPADIAYVIEDPSYVPILIINATIREVEHKNAQHY